MSEHTETPDLLSQAQVAHRLGVGRTTVWRMVKRGDLALIHIGSRALIPRVSVEAFIASQTESR